LGRVCLVLIALSGSCRDTTKVITFDKNIMF
jgi:hypothetical protein